MLGNSLRKIAKSAWCGTVYIVAMGCISAAHAQAVPGSTSLDISYASGPSQKLDVYEPAKSATPHPAVILIHGGGWTSGDKRDYAYIGRLAAAQGMVAVAINYRLADGLPDDLWPAQLQDVQAAVGWVRGNAAGLGIDVHRVCALGSSAGGHLAVFLAVTDHPASASVDCAVDEFGPVDLVKFLHGPAANLFGKAEPMQVELMKQQASPINYVSKRTAPILIVQGTDDTMVIPEQSKALHTALLNAGVPTQYIAFPGGHGFAGLTGPQYTALQKMELEHIITTTFPCASAQGAGTRR